MNCSSASCHSQCRQTPKKPKVREKQEKSWLEEPWFIRKKKDAYRPARAKLNGDDVSSMFWGGWALLVVSFVFPPLALIAVPMIVLGAIGGLIKLLGG
jgi:hypothetical protein